MKRIIKITAIWIGIFAVIIVWLARTETGGAFLCGGTETAYGPRYRERAFREINTGDSTERVRNALGEPFWISTLSKGEECWVFAKSPEDSRIHNFRIRNVIFDAKGAVKAKETGVYVD